MTAGSPGEGRRGGFKTSRLWPVLTVALVLFTAVGYVQLRVSPNHVDQQTVTIASTADAGVEEGEVPDIPEFEPLNEEHQAARLAARRGEFDVAFEKYRSVLAEYPDAGQVHGDLGYWLLVDGEAAEALAELELASQLLPQNAWVAMTLGRARLRSGDLEGAEIAYRRAQELRPGYSSAAIGLAAVLRRAGRADEAIQILEEASNSGGNHERARALGSLGRSYLAAGRREDANRVLEKAIELDPADVGVRLNVARAWTTEGDDADLPAAIELLEETALIAPEVPEVHGALGRAREQVGELVLADQHYSLALQLDPDYHYARRCLLRLNLDREDSSEAGVHAEYLLESAPEDPEHHLLAGLVSTREGRTEEARQHYADALEIENGIYPEALFNMGLLEKKAGNLDAAITAYRAAIVQRPDYDTAWNNLGLSLDAAGRLEEAEVAYVALLERNPRYASAWLNLGGTLSEMGRYEEAIESYQQALDLQPGYPKAMLNLGATYSKAGRPGDAIATYRRLVEQNPRYVTAWYNLGLALKKTGDEAGARQAWQQAVELDEGHRLSKEQLARLEVRAGHLETATALYQDMVDREPGDTKLRLAFARVLRETRDADGCRREVQAILANDPTNETAKKLGETCDQSAED